VNTKKYLFTFKWSFELNLIEQGSKYFLVNYLIIIRSTSTLPGKNLYPLRGVHWWVWWLHLNWIRTRLLNLLYFAGLVLGSSLLTTTTTTKPFISSIWGRLHETKENYVGSDTWINFLHSFLSSNMPSLRPLASISCRITSIYVFFGLPRAILTCPNLILFTYRTGASVGLRRTWPSMICWLLHLKSSPNTACRWCRFREPNVRCSET